MLGEGLTSNLTSINSQLKEAVGYLKEAKDLSKDIANNAGKTSFGNGGVGSTTTSMMPGFGSSFSSANTSAGASMGATSRTNPSSFGKWGGVATAAGNLAMGVLGAGMTAANTIGNMLPNTQQTINYAGRYYSAGVGQFGVNRQMMNAVTFNGMAGGLTGIGNDAMMALQMSRSGIAFSSNANSQYMRTLTGVSNAAKYLNMENSTALSAISGLKTGSMSSTLMRNFGIKTSDWSTGNPLTQGQIFEQLSSRMLNPGANLTTENIMSSYQRGWLGENLRNSGLSEDQQQLFMQYMLAKSQGKNLDLENPEAMKAFQSELAQNPLTASMAMNTSDTGLMKNSSDAYIKGQQEAAKIVETVNDWLGKLPDPIKAVKAEMDTLAGNNATGAGLRGLESAVTSLTGVMLGAAGLLQSLGGLGIGSKGAGGVTSSGKTKAGTPSSAASAAKAGSSAVKSVAKVAAPIAAAVGVGETITDAAQGNAASAWGDIGGTVGSIAGMFLGGLLGIESGPGAIATGAVGSMAGGAFGKWAGESLAGLFGVTNSNTAGNTGGNTPGMGTATSTSGPTVVKYVLPVNGTITDRFGPRKSNYGDNNFHNGLDIAAPQGTPIGASAAGKVVFVGVDRLGGNCVKIEHADGKVTGYFHMSKWNTAVGRQVNQNDNIGAVGMTGTATGPHCHFTVQNGINGSYLDPESVVSGVASVTSTGTQDSAQTTAQTNQMVLGAPGQATLASIMDQPSKQSGVSVSGLRMGGGAPVNALTNKPQASTALGTSIPAGGDGMGSYDPTAPRAKDGDAYVTNDGPVNVHAGEAILTAEQADEWRANQRGTSKKGGGNAVTINVTVASASEAEARRFAKIVKDYLEEDKLFGNMGRG